MKIKKKAFFNDLFLSLTVKVISLSLLIFIIIYLFYGIYKGQNAYAEILSNKIKSEKIIDEIRQTSENLTRLARLYTNTKDTLYRNQFFEVLNIYKGNAPRPQNAERVYWNVLTTKDQQDPPFAKSIKKSASKLIKDADFDAKEELAILNALNSSLALTHLEIKAISTLDGLDTENIIDEDSNQKQAIKMVNSEYYHQQIIAIMTNLNTTYELLDIRTNRNINQLSRKINGSILLIVIIFIFTIIGIIVTIYATLNLKKGTISQLKISVDNKTKELRELNASKDLFFSIIAHDLKGPFNALIGFSNLLYDEVKISKDKAFLESVEIIKNVSENTFELLQNLLEWAQMQSGRLQFKREHIKLLEVVNDVLKTLYLQSLHKKIEIKTTISDDNITVYADRNMISTMLRNLISNAIKYSHENGKVGITCAIEASSVKISVTDHGVGISDKDIEKIFNFKFVQKTLGTSGEKGTGLGLILVQDFVSKHEGTIWVKSEVGKGSTFIFSIPIVNESKVGKTNISKA